MNKHISDINNIEVYIREFEGKIIVKDVCGELMFGIVRFKKEPSLEKDPCKRLEMSLPGERKITVTIVKLKNPPELIFCEKLMDPADIIARLKRGTEGGREGSAEELDFFIKIMLSHFDPLF